MCVNISTNLKDISVDHEYFKSAIDRSETNEWIADFYKALYYEMRQSRFENLFLAINGCNKFWAIDHYKSQRIKDMLFTYHCNDKFCSHCKLVKQAVRMDRFIPELRKHDNLYHAVFTLPNVKGENLENALQLMSKSFSYLTRYLKGSAKVKGIDFLKYGYEGAFRSLEITYKGNTYHPHYHVIFKLSGDLGEKKHINAYSYDYSTGSKQLNRLFSPFEILLQKIWKLLMIGEKVNKENIEKLAVGYSVIADPITDEDTYFELFKYLTKSKDYDGKNLTYDQFKILYFATYAKKQIQGYGVFYNIKEDEQEEKRILMDLAYQDLVEKMKKIESPVALRQTTKELSEDKENIIIKRSKLNTHLSKLYHENKEYE